MSSVSVGNRVAEVEAQAEPEVEAQAEPEVEAEADPQRQRRTEAGNRSLAAACPSEEATVRIPNSLPRRSSPVLGGRSRIPGSSR